MSWRQRNVSAKKKKIFSKKSLLQAEWKQIKDLQSLNDVKTCNFSKTMLMIRYLYEIVHFYLFFFLIFFFTFFLWSILPYLFLPITAYVFLCDDGIRQIFGYNIRRPANQHGHRFLEPVVRKIDKTRNFSWVRHSCPGKGDTTQLLFEPLHKH